MPIPYKRCGKLIVARENNALEEERLKILYERALKVILLSIMSFYFFLIF